MASDRKLVATVAGAGGLRSIGCDRVWAAPSGYKGASIRSLLASFVVATSDSLAVASASDRFFLGRLNQNAKKDDQQNQK